MPQLPEFIGLPSCAHKQPEPAKIVAPIKAVYLGYSDLNPNDFGTTVRQAVDYGYNLILLAFWIRESTGVDPYSAAYYWSLLSPSTQQSVVEYAHSKGANIIVSVGGSSYGNGSIPTDYTLGGGAAYGTAAANFALENNLDGIDLDMENFTNTFGTYSGMTKEQSIAWLTDATYAARNVLGSGAIITHAPQSPYFNVEFANGYFDFFVQLPTPKPINYLLIQYYNQGATYLDYVSQMINNDNFHPGTAVAQLITRGIPKEFIVVGKLMQPSDGDPNSWVSPQEIGQWVEKAKTDADVYNWNTGISTWQWHTQGNPNAQSWISTIYPAT